MDYIPPEDVHSPRNKWVLVEVLDPAEAGGCALALGKWDHHPVLALRWNGNTGNPIGNPQSRGIATWFIVPEKYVVDLLDSSSLAHNKAAFARTYLKKE